MNYLKEVSITGLIVMLSAILFVRDTTYPMTAIPSMAFLGINLILTIIVALFLWLTGRRYPNLRIVGYSALIFVFIDLHSDLSVLGTLYLGILAAILVTVAIVWLFRKHVETIIVAVFGTMLATTLAILVFSETVELPTTKLDEEVFATENSSTENIIHIVLDEHIGIQGIPLDIDGGTETRDKLRQFFLDYGFLSYEGAYSQYFLTFDALSTHFNRNQPAELEEIRNWSDGGFGLARNDYFVQLQDRGFQIDVVQSSYLDFCRATSIRVENCETYKARNLQLKMIETFDISLQVYVMLAAYSNRSALQKHLADAYHRLQVKLTARGIELPIYNRLWRPAFWPIGARESLLKMAENYQPRPGKHLQFAHFTFPHHSYVYDAGCNINAFPWINRIGDPNDEETRRQRYRQYFGQVQCGISMMRQFFESLDSRGLLAEATIVIQGDHGSRITIGDKRKGAVDDFSPRDLRDVHSTLFAIRRPGISVGTDDRQISVSELIRHHLIDDGIQKLVPDSPHVYITGTADHYVRIPLPSFAP